MAKTDQPLIEVSGLRAGYPGQAPVINGINLRLQGGEILGVAGPNGAGKSTLIKCLGGLIQPDAGTVTIQGTPTGELSHQARAKQIATVLHDQTPDSPCSVREYVGHGRYPHTGAFKKFCQEDKEAIQKALEDCALPTLSERPVAELSAGEFQRAMLAQALAQNTPAILLDEPTTHLDLRHVEFLSRLLRHLAKERGKAILLVLHDLHFAKGLCDRVILLRQGTIHAEGDPTTVLSAGNLQSAYPDIPKHQETAITPPQPARKWLAALPSVALCLAVILSLRTGEMGIPPAKEIFALLAWKLGLADPALPSPLQTIFWELRLPRALLGIFVGANIAVAGALMQGYFRNPLAEPYVTGVSAGAACGAVLILTTGLSSLLALPQAFALPIAAFLGAILSTYAIFRISTWHGKTSTRKLLLGGIAIGGILQAVTIGLLLQADPHNMQNVISWLMGSLAYRSWEHVPAVMAGGLAGLVIALILSRPLDLLATEGENALTLGVPVQTVRRSLLATASFLAATSVASCGIIAFVGLMAPHITRMLFGSRHSILLPQTAILGALLLTMADILARILLPSQEMPVGIITGVIGAIFLLFLLSQGNGPAKTKKANSSASP
jgi:iron complex transport system permease protein